MDRRFLAGLVFAALLLAPGCAGSQDGSNAQKSRAGTTQPATPSPARMEALIERLAISQEPAGDNPIYTPSRNTPASDPRVIAYKAAEELASHGKTAFPCLLKHLHDSRQSVAFRRMIPHDVGLACFCIIEDQVLLLPNDYQGSFFRTGADGQMHERPRFGKPGLFTMETVDAWLAERQDKSLAEMQTEALEWLIAEEKKIGFASEEDKQRFLYPLERQLARIRKQAHSP